MPKMSSKNPVVKINHPVPPNPPNGEKPSQIHAAPNQTSVGIGRKASPGLNSTSPLSLPRTPPIPTAFVVTPPAQDNFRQDANYFSPQPQRPSARISRTESPSDNASNVYSLSPSFGSYHSSDLGRTTCSGSSSEYLTPPLFQGDDDNPPYKPRRGSAGSLTMIKKVRRANTMPYDKEAKRKARKSQRKRHRCSHRKVKMHEHKSRSYWWLPGCQVVPTAPRGQKDMCEGQDGHHKRSKLRDTNTSGRLSPGITPNLASKSARRWSSVEIGAHQIISELTSALRPISSAALASPTSEDFSTNLSFGPRFRSSTFTRGAMDNDIVRTVRQRLTLRRIPSAQLQMPASITLRRASVVSSRSGRSRTSQTPSTYLKSDEPSGGSTPLAKLQGFFNQRRPSAAYLITSKDIDSITELIEQNLKRKYEKKLKTSATNSSSGGSPSPSITSRGVVIPQSLPDLAISVAEAQASSTPLREPFDYLQVKPVRTGRTNLSRAPSNHSEHEVIWQGGGSPQSTSSVTEEESRPSPYCDCSQGSGTPRDMFQFHVCKARQTFPTAGNAFDPRDANASINEWSSRTEQIGIPLVVTSSDSESNDICANIDASLRFDKNLDPVQSRTATKTRVKHRARKGPRPALSESNLHQSRSRGLTLKDVISFPPLPPRKTTEEWYSPLPEMITTPPLMATRSLYDVGLDANFGPLSSKTVTPKASQANFPRSADLSPPSTLSPARSIEFKPGFDMRKKSVVKSNPTIGPLSPFDSPVFNQEFGMRKRSIVKDHPTAVPRTGDLCKMGSAIGSHGHERRRSSAVPVAKIQRVRTIDNVHKGERDAPPSKWRKPSVCPSRQPSMPMDNEDSQPPSPANTARKVAAGLLDRASLVKDRSPQQPKLDTVGIYGQLTGTKQANSLKDPCLLESGPCQPHDCDDCARDPRTPSVDWIG